MQFLHGPALPKCNNGRDSRVNLWYKLSRWEWSGRTAAGSVAFIGIRKKLTDTGVRAKHVGEACAAGRGVALCGEEV